MSLPSSQIDFHLTHSQNFFMSFVENGYVEVNNDKLNVLLQGAPINVQSSIRICVLWSVLTNNLVEL